MLDNFELLDFTESQIVSLKNKMTYVTPTQRIRTKLLGQFVNSLCTDLISFACKSCKLPVIFGLKHHFVGYNVFEIDPELAKSFKKWIGDRFLKKCGRFVFLFFSFIIIFYFIYLKFYIFLGDLVSLQLYRTRSVPRLIFWCSKN